MWPVLPVVGCKKEPVSKRDWRCYSPCFFETEEIAKRDRSLLGSFRSSARLFAEQGLPLAFTPLSDTLGGFEDVPLRLAEMVKAGMPERDVLAAVTTTPAKLLGLEGKIGTLSKSALASFCVYRGDPLGGSARLLKAFVDGTEVFSDDPATGKLGGEAVR